MYTDQQITKAAQMAYNDYDISSGDNSIDSVNEGWKIINSYNDEGAFGSGLQAYVIDTNDGNCIISFRGTQPTSARSFSQDILFADLGLLNSGETPQQKAAEKYVQYIYEQLGDKYQNFTFVGHSLGGNIAEHAAITAPDEMKIRSRAVSLDGPGFSDIYIQEHKSEIAQMTGRLERNSWSTIGAFLHSVPGEEYNYIEVRDNFSQTKLLDFEYHSDFDNIHYNGNEYKKDSWIDNITGKVIGDLSRGLDNSLFIKNLFGLPSGFILNQGLESTKRTASCKSKDPSKSVWAPAAGGKGTVESGGSKRAHIHAEINELNNAAENLWKFKGTFEEISRECHEVLEQIQLSMELDDIIRKKIIKLEYNITIEKVRLMSLHAALHNIINVYSNTENNNAFSVSNARHIPFAANNEN